MVQQAVAQHVSCNKLNCKERAEDKENRIFGKNKKANTKMNLISLKLTIM